jgi:hypothetical protein
MTFWLLCYICNSTGHIILIYWFFSCLNLEIMAKFIFVTGGVTSSLGKGIIAASLAKLLQARGIRVTIQKFDPYINVDPGTLNPYEHGECFVTEDGAETDLDLGHYERYLNIFTSQANSDKQGTRRCLSWKNCSGSSAYY